MFGLWRTTLALCVVAYHLLEIPVIGEYAVFSFFVLSGFLMTTIMHESYGYDSNGRRRYALNRFLRLYPSYWVSAIIALVVILYCGETFVRSYKNIMFMPHDAQSVFYNFVMIFPSLFPNDITPRLSPPTWALTVEITYYIAIGIGISRTRGTALIWLAASSVYVLATFVFHLGHLYDYAAITAGSFPFAVGSCLYFYKDLVRLWLDKLSLNLPVVAGGYVALFAAFTVAAWLGHTRLAEKGLYIDVAAAALLLVRLHFDGVPGLPRWLDKLIGDYSYPIYLLHWPLGALSSFLLFHHAELGESRASLAVFGLDLLLVGAASSFIIFVIDPSIERVRARIRGQTRPRIVAETPAVAGS
jgi:peptidoglycan/LPS O-acetylase OafA/YrhL